MEDRKMSLYEKLKTYSRTDAYPMHMPGHKRNTARFSMENPYGLDITEIDGFDDLHEPEEILKEGMERAAVLYGAEESWYLINGSTAGILSGIAACVRPGDKILMARNCHKSVYHAVALNQLRPTYLHPKTDQSTGILASLDPIEVELALAAQPDTRLVVLTSPTYEGIISDIQMIASICHRRGIPLLVDEAHGAHLSSGRMYTSCFPEGAVACGADLVVQSLHKTLPAFTQTGLIHRQGDLVESRRVKRALDIYQTSSPSYILMSGIERCVDWMAREGREILGSWAERLQYYYRRMEELKVLRVLTLDSCERFFAWDPSKLVISTRGTGHSGKELMEMLRDRFHIELEMASSDYVIAMTGAGDTMEGIERFAEAVLAIDEEWYKETIRQNCQEEAEQMLSADENRSICGKRDKESGDAPRVDGIWEKLVEKVVCQPWEAELAEGEYVPLGRESCGRVSLEFVYAYPPGIPVLAPGEAITEEVCRVIETYEGAGIAMRGYERQEEHRIRVLQ